MIDLAAVIPYNALNATDASDLVFWAQADLVDIGQEEIVRLAHMGVFVTGTAKYIQTDGASVYPPGYLATVGAEFDGTYVRPATVREIEARDDQWDTHPGTPTHLVEGHLGASMRLLYPQPQIESTLLTIDRYIPEADAIPACLADVFALRMIAEARSREGDGAMPDVSQMVAAILGVLDQAIAKYWT